MCIKLKSAFFLLVVSFISLGVNAQDSEKKNTGNGEGGFRLSIGRDGGKPIGRLSHHYSWIIGSSVQADLPIISDALYATLNSGFFIFFGKHHTHNLNTIPIKAGLKYFVIRHLYVHGEAGISIIANKKKVIADKSTVFTYSPQVGYLINLRRKNAIDIGVRYQGDSRILDGADGNNYIGLRIAYSLAL